VKALERAWIDARARLRTLRGRTAGRAGLPARIVLRLDDLDPPPSTELFPGAGGSTPRNAPRPDGEPPAADALVAALAQAGAVPVHLVARATHDDLVPLARLAMRLDAPVHIRTSASGLDAAQAAALLDARPVEIHVRVAGTSDAVQGAVLGEDVATGIAALTHLMRARHAAGAATRILAAWVPSEDGAPQLRGVFDQARRAGLDGVVIVAPWTGMPVGDALRAALAWADTQHAPFHATPPAVRAWLADMTADGAPGLPGRRGACPIADVQWDLSTPGCVRACPFQPDPAPLDAESWHPALAAHRDRVRSCGRRCAHPDVPAP
jgi:hypothetical protein